MEPVRERFVQGADLRLRVVEQGVPGGPVVVLVHGYPDRADVWDGVAARLGRRFRVVRYDVRGSGGSEVPAATDGYGMEFLVADLVAVVRDVGWPVHLVGHDWGSVQGWAAVAAHPELFLSFTSMSGPDLGQSSDWIRRHRHRPVKVFAFLRRSWYIAGFLVPLLPELVWSVPAARRLVGGGRRELVNGLGLYRANFGRGRPARRVDVRVHQIELARDPYVTREHLDAAEPWAPRLTRSSLQAGHWAPRTHPDQVARHIENAIDGKRRRELVVVAGGGPAVARAFAERGAEVVSLDVDAPDGTAYRVDLTDEAAVRAIAEVVRDRHGVPDVVVVDAGIATAVGDWRQAVDVDLWGVVHTLRGFAPQLVERAEGGHLVVTVSPAHPAYSATKDAVSMLARCLRAELREHGIGVSVVCAGPDDVAAEVSRVVRR